MSPYRVFVARWTVLAIAVFSLGGLEAAQAEATAPPAPPRIVYPKKTELDFEGLRIQGEVRNPGEFYYQRKSEESFDSLVKRRPNFRREMMRDVVMSR
jgi:hypothetical protein